MATLAIPVYEVLPVDKNFAVRRNGVDLKTPAGVDLTVPTARLAEVIAEEWRAQKDKFNPSSMPMTQLAMTSIDMISKNRVAVVEQVASYAAADLLCFRAEGPDELIIRQQKIWQPVLDWCTGRFDALLLMGQGIMPIAQPPEALRALRRAVEAYDVFRLTGVKQAAEVTGSLVLALALIERYLTAEQVFNAAELDSHFQVEKWGDDPALSKRHESIRDDLAACQKWFELL